MAGAKDGDLIHAGLVIIDTDPFRIVKMSTQLRVTILKSLRARELACQGSSRRGAGAVTDSLPCSSAWIEHRERTRRSQCSSPAGAKS